LLNDPTFLRPVLETLAFALVPPYRELEAPEGTTVQLSVEGPSGGDWAVVRDATGWALRVGQAEASTGSVSMDEDCAWRMYVRSLTREEVARRSTFGGDVAFASRLLEAFALVS
jgi:hypothetical protein